MLLLRLAFAAGKRSVREYLHGMSSSEVTEALAYHLLEPRGDERCDWNAARICQAWAGGEIDDWRLKFGERHRPTEAEQRFLLQVNANLLRASGG